SHGVNCMIQYPFARVFRAGVGIEIPPEVNWLWQHKNNMSRPGNCLQRLKPFLTRIRNSNGLKGLHSISTAFPEGNGYRLIPRTSCLAAACRCRAVPSAWISGGGI